MPYLRRSAEGAIIALLNEPAPGAEEFQPATSPEVCAFLGLPPAHGFVGLDADFIRVMEDLIDVMLDKGLLRLTDLPAEAQRKLITRKDMRRRMNEALDLLGEQDVI